SFVYIRLPPRTIPRRHREAAIESLLKKLLENEELGKSTVIAVLAILVRLMGVPNPTSKLLTDVKSWKSLGKAVKGYGLADDPVMSSLFHELVRLSTVQSSYLKDDIRESFTASLTKTCEKYGKQKRKTSQV